MPSKTVKEVIQQLEKLPQDMEMYFDCPRCGRAYIFNSARHVVVVETRVVKEKQECPSS